MLKVTNTTIFILLFNSKFKIKKEVKLNESKRLLLSNPFY